MSQPAAQSLLTNQANPHGKVGYGKPPVEHQYKKGVSGNPKGRPRRKPAEAEDPPSELYGIMEAELGRTIKIIENGRVRKVSVQQAIIRSVATQALKGSLRASGTLFHLQRMLDRDRRRDRQRSFERQVDYKRRWAETIRRFEFMGDEPPNPVPHPDDMQIDSKRQRVVITGPADDVEKEEWDAAENERQSMVEWIAHLTKVLTGPEEGLRDYRGSRAFVLELHDESKEELAALDATYPSKKQRRSPGYTHKFGRDQSSKNIALSVMPPITDTRAACDGRITQQDLQSRLKQSKETLAYINKQIRSYGEAPEPPSTDQDDDNEEREWQENEENKKSIQKSIRNFRKVLTKSDEELKMEGWSREIVSVHIEHDKKELAKYNAFHPTAAQRSKPGFNLKQWRKRKGGREPPRLH